MKLQQEYARTCSTELVLFPVLSMVVLQVYSLCTILICWTSEASRSGPLIWADNRLSSVVTHCASSRDQQVPTLSQRGHKLRLSSCRTAMLQRNTPFGIPAGLHLFSNITSALGCKTLKLSLHRNLTLCFSLYTAKLVWKFPFLTPTLLCRAVLMTTMCWPSLCWDVWFGIFPCWQACQSCTCLSFSVPSNEEKDLTEF